VRCNSTPSSSVLNCRPGRHQRFDFALDCFAHLHRITRGAHRKRQRRIVRFTLRNRPVQVGFVNLCKAEVLGVFRDADDLEGTVERLEPLAQDVAGWPQASCQSLVDDHDQWRGQRVIAVEVPAEHQGNAKRLEVVEPNRRIPDAMPIKVRILAAEPERDGIHDRRAFDSRQRGHTVGKLLIESRRLADLDARLFGGDRQEQHAVGREPCGHR
jgi:hypothetical protein